MENQPVSVTILGREYKLKIAKNSEEYLRKAADLINNQAKQYGKNFGYYDHQDLLAMVALGQITELIKLQSNLEFKDNELLNKLTNIDNVLEKYLHPTQNSL
jgi:cell division protein ZapA (FtsZ GTPase activity inhibitor)